jgi:hypothetical protein
MHCSITAASLFRLPLLLLQLPKHAIAAAINATSTTAHCCVLLQSLLCNLSPAAANSMTPLLLLLLLLLTTGCNYLCH